MQGFKDFLTRGNLIELAVAFIMGTAFATVVSAFAQIFLDIIGKVGGVESLSKYQPYGISVGGFLSALLTFLVTAAILYFAVIVPYNRFTSLRKQAEEQPVSAPTTDDLLAEIRDLLREKA